MLFEQEQSEERVEARALPASPVVLSALEVLATLRSVKYATKNNRPRVAFDTETYLILQGLAAPRLVCGGFCTEAAESGLYLRDDTIYLLHAFLDNDWVIVGHNIAYDFAVCCAIDPTLLPKIARAYDEDRVEDTGVRDKLILLSQGLLADEGEVGSKAKNRFNLAAIIKRRFNVDISEEKGKAKVLPNGTVIYEGLVKGQEAPWRLRYRELDDVPLDMWPERAKAYAIDDPRWTMAVWIHQQIAALEEFGGPIPDEHPQARGALWLKFMGAWGVRTDPERVRDLAENTKAEYEHMNDVLRKAGLLKSKMVKGVEVESKDMTALRSLVVQAYGGEHSTPKTAGGKKGVPNIATDRDTLLASPHTCLPGCTPLEFKKDANGKQLRTGGCVEGCVNGVLRAVGERSGVEKILTTFVPTLLSGTQVPINPYWNEIVASGRTSARDPNLQQPPRKGGIRECFIPRRGWLYAEADYSFIELCTLAQACIDLFGMSKLATAINEDLDPHLDMASLLLGISYAEAKARKGEEIVKDRRQLSKVANFGFPGGMGPDSFVEFARANYGVNITADDARKLKPRWLQKWPEMVLYLRYMGQPGHPATNTGKRIRREHSEPEMQGKARMEQLRSGRVRGGTGYCDGCNTTFQGMAADGAKRAGWMLFKECYLEDPYRDGKGPTALFGSRLVLFLHDEFVLETPDNENAPRAAARLAEVMVEGMRYFTPDVKVKAEPLLMRRWYKGAEPRFNADGVLIPWEPK
jgi:hypothetical protein